MCSWTCGAIPGRYDPEAGPLRTFLTVLARRCVQHLPGDQRRVVELAYFQGLTCREVALAAGIPEGTAKSRLRLALAKLETMLDRQLLESS
jgi:RNA polymerase sigma-70 factor (ECF subfamily)